MKIKRSQVEIRRVHAFCILSCIMKIVLADPDRILLSLCSPRSGDVSNRKFPLLDAVVSKYLHRCHINTARGMPCNSLCSQQMGSICLECLNAFRKLVWMICVYKDYTCTKMGAVRIPCRAMPIVLWAQRCKG
jgi:hypothetical protein